MNILKEYTKNLSKLLFCTCLFCSSTCAAVYGQENTSIKTPETDLFKQALELYQEKMYSAAYKEFDKILTYNSWLYNSNDVNIARVEGYKLLCKIMLSTGDIDGAVNEYEFKYPSSELISQIKFRYAIINFDNGNFTRANELFSNIDSKSLSAQESEEYWFRKAYCLMRVGDNAQALNIFENILSGPYMYPAKYYSGYIRYIKKDFEQAIPLFETAKGDSRFSTLSNYHILESKFMLKDYNYVINNGAAIYEQISDEYKPKVARIMSEAYYSTNNPDKAKYYYQIYSVNSNNISRKDYFYEGMISYTLNANIEAIESFKKVISTSDSLGQSAYYHQGQCYIRLKNKHMAQESFMMASKMGYDKTIQEDAFFNYAKLTFDLNRNIEPFTEYLSAYPTSNLKWDEVHSYMATAFLLNKEYDRAIDALKNIKNQSAATINNLQKAEFLRGMQLVQSGSYNKASEYFVSCNEHSNNNTALTNLANYWLAECKYRNNEFSKSLEILNNLEKSLTFRNSNEYASSVYNKAYNYFKLGNFDSAINEFNKYLSFGSFERFYTQEAKTRLADSYFYNRDYQTAANIYTEVATENNYKDLYAPLQGAIAYGLLSNDDKKISLLKTITTDNNRKSPLYSKALYELGRTYVQNSKDDQAQQVMNRLINNPNDSTYYYKALLEMGMINANNGLQDKALHYYKQIIEKNPISDEGQSALAGIENIYQQQNKSAEFLDYLETIGLSTIKTASEKETMLFSSAEQLFLGKNYTAALKSLNSFLSKYPDGANASQATFYIAECYNNLGKTEAAADAYYKVMDNGDGAFSEIATLNYGRLSYQLQKYDQAILAYQTLGKIAVLENNKLEANIGRMNSYYMLKNFDNAINECNDLLAMDKLNNHTKRQAEYIKAKSLSYIGERKEANKLFTALAKNTNDAFGAESAYLLILDAYDAGSFDSVEKQTFAFSDSKTTQTYWLAKSFIVLGDSYAERDNMEQAKATFESIRDNYTPGKNDDVIEQVKMRLSKIK